jgi:hypothetical protein
MIHFLSQAKLICYLKKSQALDLAIGIIDRGKYTGMVIVLLSKYEVILLPN